MGTGWFQPRQDELAIPWLRDESLEESANLSNPDIRAQEIVEDLDLSEHRDDLA